MVVRGQSPLSAEGYWEGSPGPLTPLGSGPRASDSYQRYGTQECLKAALPELLPPPDCPSFDVCSKKGNEQKVLIAPSVWLGLGRLLQYYCSLTH